MKRVPDLTVLKKGYPGVQTLLFDMDGTLFNTEIYHTQALQKIGREQKIVPPLGPRELHQLLMGKADHLVYELIKEWPGFPSGWDRHVFVSEKNRHLISILAEVDGDSYFPALTRTLLKEARENGLKLGLVTSSEKIITYELLKLTQSETSFDFILTRDDSLEVKPHPWPYLTAMRNLKADATTTVIFEDSQVGLEAAHASGAHVIKADWF